MAITIPIRSAAPLKSSILVPAGAALTSLPPLSVYVHVPWCVRKCPYCDFNSHAMPGQDIPERAYLDALRADLEQAVPLVWGRQVISVFIGGGTPSLLSAAGLDELLAMLRACLNLLPDAEITMEANPGTAEASRFLDYAASGVTRFSLGIQSFDDAQLHKLGRIHDSAQARAAIEMAQRAVSRVNLDVMFALPGQDINACVADLREALSFGTEHLSLYHLTLEPNTVFAKYPPELPDDDDSAAMQDAVEATLADAGLARYEVSAYARQGARCKHNVNYWEFGDYLGLGPGAHGKLSFHDRIVREARHRNPESWMQRAMARDGSHVAENRQVGPDELPFEFMLNALRLKDGVAASSFSERTGLSLAAIAHQLDAASQRGLLDADPTRLRATALGWRFLNDLQEIFL
ncbi:radical SAM family heme chaperone HemW [Bordetella avium]|uniref:Heme chaperone HemW n=1 Tax=Bordetella avium (strain 197N) TaxID=360910 RepID=Q2L0C8_BORA1|nr:radical SAM family heme chaperone HemW [Bordetella avium]AZY49271.1 oxygen-independent coproporphyrinogen III oxidase-like protein [Bordetella avium]RIQ12750.1 oxygen-independent coproporphyrinogen III oxidase-like protein [Bordetella avium]RIQ19212.1 oxygen-independent coproporphyrinogen III oxidase-like protein [Bordetella avium]RIQ33379.1 oxygen-independent coproporphyrinogen III oxidase-like protein [Bordetella avium]RIQ37924.1 oxygen-independent coproporphyrinogen III oxidase-like prot